MFEDLAEHTEGEKSVDTNTFREAVGCEPVLKTLGASTSAPIAPAAASAAAGKAKATAPPTAAAAAQPPITSSSNTSASTANKKGKKKTLLISWKDLSSEDTLNLSTKVFQSANDMLDQVLDI